MVQFCTFVTGVTIIAGFLDAIEWGTVGWIVLGLFILNGVVSWSNARSQISRDS